MSGSNQPASLQSMSLDVLLQYVLRLCDQFSAESLDVLREGIAAIKDDIRDRIPWHLLAEFSSRFLNKFCATDRPESHCTAALEMVMDIEIIGLKCEGLILRFLDPHDAHRIEGLKILDLSFYRSISPTSLQNFRLQDLTTFIFVERCTDADLTVIGQDCSKLQILEVSNSRKVTDLGLTALSPWSELRDVDLVNCSVSESGINDFRSLHEKIYHLSHNSSHRHSRDCDLLSDSVTKSPHVGRFVFGNDCSCTEDRLSCLVRKFPNLRHFVIDASSLDDGLDVLGSLDKLTTIDIALAKVDDPVHNVSRYDVEETWYSLQVLLANYIGKNVISLQFRLGGQNLFFDGEDLKFIVDNCPNIERLGFTRGFNVDCFGVTRYTLHVPSFPKLKELVLYVPLRNSLMCKFGHNPRIKFDKMLELEYLSVVDFHVSLKFVKWMMLNKKRFPKLTVIRTNCLTAEELACVEKLATEKNIDFKIEQ